MDCSGFRARHLEFVDGTVDERTLVACERHRAECAACATLDTRVRRGLLVCHNVAMGGPTCDLTARVLAGVRADRRRRERQRAWRRAVTGWASLCAACAVAAFGVSEWRGRGAPASTAVATSPSPLPPPLPAPPSLPASAPLVPILGPIDAAVEVLGDTFPSAPLGRPREPMRRVSEAGFLTVAFPAP
jgi:hypothetical protein